MKVKNMIFNKLKNMRSIKICTSFIVMSFSYYSYALQKEVAVTVNKNVPTGEIYEKLNTKIDLNLHFTNQDGKSESLQEMFKNEKVLILSFNYFSCTTMCTFQFMNLSKTLKKMNWPIGKGFRIASISFDPKDKVTEAKLLKKNWLPKTGQPNAQWDFFVGKKTDIISLTKQLNFYYEPDEEGETYSHAGALYFIKSDGTFYRYLYGIVYSPEDIKHALIDTSNGELGSFFEKIPLKLKKYEPNYGKYASN